MNSRSIQWSRLPIRGLDFYFYSVFERVVAEEGMGAFDGSSSPEASNVIPFRRPQ